MYIRVTTNTIERGKGDELRQVIEEMTLHREHAGYVTVEWLTSLTGAPDELISVQRYERLADYETSLEQIADDTAYRSLLGRLKACTVSGTGRVQFLRTFA